MVATVTALCFLGYFLGYSLYARFLARRVFALDPERVVPAHAQRDEVDYVPTRRLVLFGHHYASITGLSPMLGPAVAVIWGWVPALLWVVLGALFIGCVHDFGALVVSLRARGMSIAKVTEGVIGHRAKTLFHLIIFFGIVVGYLTYRRRWPLLPVAAVAFVLTLLVVRAGVEWPLIGLARDVWPSHGAWIWILLAYALAASVLPVWSLLQARDFLNSLLLYLGLGLAYAGLFVWRPEFAAPAFRMRPPDAPSFFPFVFIIIACGAASGFHSLVSSGTTAKQLDREPDARPIGYGGMIGESLLGLLAVLACTAGIIGAGGVGPAELWQRNYADWGAVQSLGRTIGTFITGAAHFIERLGVLDYRLCVALVAVVVVSFAMTTLDSATRLLRFNISEIGETLGLRWLHDRYLAGLLAVAAIAWFAFYDLGGQPAGLVLWQLFGTTNQLLAGLALLVVTLYLAQRGRNPWFTGVPMAFMLVSTVIAMVENLRGFWEQRESGGAPLFVVGGILLGLALWLVVEAVLAFWRLRGRAPVTSVEVPLRQPGT